MIKINDEIINAKATVALDGSMSIEYETDMSLDLIEGTFSEGITIDIIENGETTAKYYNKELKSLSITGRDPRKVRVVLKSSPMPETVEEQLRKAINKHNSSIEELEQTISEINGDIEISDGAIGDLADTVSTINDDFEVINAAVQELADLLAQTIEGLQGEENNG